MRRSKRKGERAKAGSRHLHSVGGGRQWVGGCLTAPFFVDGGDELYRPPVVLWIELPEGLIVGQKLLDPGREEGAVLAVLRSAMEAPMVGPPRRPDTLRVSDEALAGELRAALGGEIAVVAGATPELDQIMKALADSRPPSDEDPSYLAHTGVSAETVGGMFTAAKLLYPAKPWRFVDESQILRLDIPELEVEGACVSIFGEPSGGSPGFAIFPSADAFDRFAQSGPDLLDEDRLPDLGSSFLSLSFDRGAALPASMRREVAKYQWPVANARAYPTVLAIDRDSVSRPASDRDLRIVSACAAALAPFCLEHREIFAREAFLPVSESFGRAPCPVVRLTVPYEAYELFADEDPSFACDCPCHDGIDVDCDCPPDLGWDCDCDDECDRDCDCPCHDGLDVDCDCCHEIYCDCPCHAGIDVDCDCPPDPDQDCDCDDEYDCDCPCHDWDDLDDDCEDFDDESEDEAALDRQLAAELRPKGFAPPPAIAHAPESGQAPGGADRSGHAQSAAGAGTPVHSQSAAGAGTPAPGQSPAGRRKGAPRPAPSDAAPGGLPKVGRNDPCPCGSGKKYKKCHMAADSGRQGAATEAEAAHAMDQGLLAEIFEAASDRFGADFAAHAMDFRDPAETMSLIVHWAVYHFPIASIGKRTAAQWYIEEYGDRLYPAERAWLAAQRKAWLTLWEVTEVEAGEGMVLEDMLTGEVRRVREKGASQTLVKRDVVLARIVDHHGLSLLCGMHPRWLSPVEGAAVVDRVRARLRRKRKVAVERLRDAAIGRLTIAQWEESVAESDRRRSIPPELRNTDGEPLLLVSECFDIEPVARREVELRIAALEGVERVEGGWNECAFEFLAGAAEDSADAAAQTAARSPGAAGPDPAEPNRAEPGAVEPGALQRHAVEPRAARRYAIDRRTAQPRAGESGKAVAGLLPAGIVIGRATLSQRELRVETNSEQRADRLHERVKAACRGLIKFRQRECDDLTALVAGRGRGGVAGAASRHARGARPARQTRQERSRSQGALQTGAAPGGFRDAPASQPEEQAILSRFKQQHYASWPDVALPALGGLTPRQSAASASGRAALDILLKDMENHEQRLPPGERFDFTGLRRELGLDP